MTIGDQKYGGPAFPGIEIDKYSTLSTAIQQRCGMTLRDYFAAHCDQPGQAEIVAAAGLRWERFQVITQDGESKCSFNDFWDGTPTEERFALYAKVRYQMADAMLKARDAGEATSQEDAK